MCSAPFPLLLRRATQGIFTVALLFLFSASMQAGPADDLIAKGDAYYDQLNAKEALKYYLAAEKLDPENVRLLVHISREYRHLMSDASKPEEKLRLGNIAVDYAKRAAALGPQDAEAQLAVAISYGKLQPLEGNKERLETSRIIRVEADKTLKLNPRSDLAWHVLGRWNMGLRGGFQREAQLWRKWFTASCQSRLTTTRPIVSRRRLR